MRSLEVARRRSVDGMFSLIISAHIPGNMITCFIMCIVDATSESMLGGSSKREQKSNLYVYAENKCAPFACIVLACSFVRASCFVVYPQKESHYLYTRDIQLLASPELRQTACVCACVFIVSSERVVCASPGRRHKSESCACSVRHACINNPIMWRPTGLIYIICAFSLWSRTFYLFATHIFVCATSCGTFCVPEIFSVRDDKSLLFVKQ